MTPWIGPNGQIMERLELHLTYTCPEKCVFCSEEHRMKKFRKFPVTWGRVARVLRLHAERGVRAVHFTGGEPSIHPRFVDVLRLAKKLKMRTSIGTIGTMLSRPEFAKKVFPYLDEALFSIHGPDPQSHDSLTRRAGSFEKVTKAMRNMTTLDPNFGAFVNTVITRHNISLLPKTVELVQSMGAKLIVVSNTTPEGAGADNYEELAPRLSDLVQFLPQAVDKIKTSVLRFFGVSMCVLGSNYALSNDLHWDPRVTVEWAEEPGKVVFDGIYSWRPDRKRRHVQQCHNCIRNTVCMGVFEEYADKWGTKELVPHHGVANEAS